MSAQPKWAITGLVGRYCPDCVKTLVDFRLARYSLLPMCFEDFHQFLENGDRERVEKMIGKQEAKNG